MDNATAIRQAIYDSCRNVSSYETKLCFVSTNTLLMLQQRAIDDELTLSLCSRTAVVTATKFYSNSPTHE